MATYGFIHDSFEVSVMGFTEQVSWKREITSPVRLKPRKPCQWFVLRNLRKPKSPITDGLLVLARTAIPLRRGHDLQTHATTSNIHHNHQPIWDR
jgi:hypothetical protein